MSKNEQELRERIVNTITTLNNICRTGCVCEDYKYENYDNCTEYAIADALIAANIGDVKEAVKDFAKKITVLIKGTMGMGTTDFWKGYNKAKYDVIEIIKQAEKELEEEGGK